MKCGFQILANIVEVYSAIAASTTSNKRIMSHTESAELGTKAMGSTSKGGTCLMSLKIDVIEGKVRMYKILVPHIANIAPTNAFHILHRITIASLNEPDFCTHISQTLVFCYHKRIKQCMIISKSVVRLRTRCWHTRSIIMWPTRAASTYSKAMLKVKEENDCHHIMYSVAKGKTKGDGKADTVIFLLIYLLLNKLTT